MDINELKETDIWNLYTKHVNFMYLRHIYSDTDLNNRMYNGDQWKGLNISGIEKIQYNFIKPIVKHKVSTITSNLFAINYSPENIENSEFMKTALKVCELLNKKASKVWDKDFMDYKIKKWARQSAINDEAICYVYYNEDTNLPVNEIIAKNDIMYGDENESEIQLQPYILLRQRKTVIELRAIAEKLGKSEIEIKSIVGDNDTSTSSGESSKDEVEDKCWLLTKYYRNSNGNIHYSQSTKYCELKKDADMGIELYPFEHFNWEDQEGNARGVGEVRQLIPNQLETNKTAMRRALTTKSISYPQKVVNQDSIQNKRDINKIGSTIYFKDMGNTKASDVYMMTIPGQMGPDSEKLQSELITLSRELNNAGDATTGNIDPQSASGRAILAVQNAQNQPLNDQVVGLKTFIEGIARIWFELWKVHVSDNLTVEDEIKDPVTGESSIQLIKVPSYILEELNTSVKVDITPKGPYDKYAQELSLENLLLQKIISFEEYVNSLDADSVMPKAKLEVLLQKRKEAEQQIDQIEQQAIQMQKAAQFQNATLADIDNIGNIGNTMLGQTTMNS